MTALRCLASVLMVGGQSRNRLDAKTATAAEPAFNFGAGPG
jgi:hypothetical protein